MAREMQNWLSSSAQNVVGMLPFAQVGIPPVKALYGMMSGKGIDKFTMRQIGLQHPVENVAWAGMDFAGASIKYAKYAAQLRNGVGPDGKRLTHSQRRMLQFNTEKAMRGVINSTLRFGGPVTGMPTATGASGLDAFLRQYEEKP
jgi:hypothetical protein